MNLAAFVIYRLAIRYADGFDKSPWAIAESDFEVASIRFVVLTQHAFDLQREDDYEASNGTSAEIYWAEDYWAGDCWSGMDEQ